MESGKSGNGLIAFILAQYRIFSHPLPMGNTPWRNSPGSGNLRVMARGFLALFLLIFGLNLLFKLSIPIWVTGVLALTAGVLLLVEQLKIGGSRK